MGILFSLCKKENPYKNVPDDDIEDNNKDSSGEFWYCLSNVKHHKTTKYCRCFLEKISKENTI